MVGSISQTFRGGITKICAEIGKWGCNIKCPAQIVRGPHILGHQLQWKAGVKCLRQDKLLELQIGRIVAAGGRIQDICDKVGIEAEFFGN